MSELKRSWLVQRLCQPTTGVLDNPFSFGGGLRNGGLRPEAMDLLRPIFSFDYMGSAEFELGKLPETLHELTKEPLAAFRVVFIPKAGEERAVYVLAKASQSDAVAARVMEWLAKEPALKQWMRLHLTLEAQEGEQVAGWLELNNGFFFFADKTMADKTCELFGVEVLA